MNPQNITYMEQMVLVSAIPNANPPQLQGESNSSRPSTLPPGGTGPPRWNSSSRPSRAPTSWPRVPTAARTFTSRARPSLSLRQSSPSSPRRPCTSSSPSTSSCPPRGEEEEGPLPRTGARVSAPAQACAVCPSVRVWACSREPRSTRSPLSSLLGVIIIWMAVV